jgi:hypothetical protein
VAVRSKQNELVSNDARGRDGRQIARSGPMAAQLAENGDRVPAQANEYQHAEERKCDQVECEQHSADCVMSEPHRGDCDDAGRHDERETASGKIERHCRDCRSAREYAVRRFAAIFVTSRSRAAFDGRSAYSAKIAIRLLK